MNEPKSAEIPKRKGIGQSLTLKENLTRKKFPDSVKLRRNQSNDFKVQWKRYREQMAI